MTMPRSSDRSHLHRACASIVQRVTLFRFLARRPTSSSAVDLREQTRRGHVDAEDLRGASRSSREALHNSSRPSHLEPLALAAPPSHREPQQPTRRTTNRSGRTSSARPPPMIPSISSSTNSTPPMHCPAERHNAPSVLRRCPHTSSSLSTHTWSGDPSSIHNSTYLYIAAHAHP